MIQPSPLCPGLGATSFLSFSSSGPGEGEYFGMEAKLWEDVGMEAKLQGPPKSELVEQQVWHIPHYPNIINQTSSTLGCQ